MRLDNLNLSMTSEFKQFTYYWYGFKNAEYDLNGVKTAIFAANLQKLRNGWGLCPLCATLELQLLVQHGS